MKDSGIAWVGEIPDNWEIIANKHLFGLNKTIVNNPDNFQLLSLTTKGVKEKSIEDVSGKVPENYNGYQVVEKNDLILCLFDLDCSAVFSGVSNYCGMISPAYKVFKTKANYSEKFARYWFDFIGRDRLYKQFSKTLRYTITSEEFLCLKSVVPSIAEQKQIADYLDKKCGGIDALKEDIKTQIETLEQYKRSVITEAVTKGLNKSAPLKDSGVPWVGAIPKNWKCVKGKYLFAQRNLRGNKIELQLLSPSQRFGVIPQTVYEELTTQVVVKVKDNTNLSLFKTVHKGDFCISLRSFQGGFEYSAYEGVVSPAYTIFYPIINICDGYYKRLFKENSFIEIINSYALSLRDGKNISFEDFGKTYIPYPPINEQKQIADYLDKKCAEIDKIISDKQSQIETLEEYKKSLIFEYVTGKKQVG